jgi:hypothetical protein
MTWILIIIPIVYSVNNTDRIALSAFCVGLGMSENCDCGNPSAIVCDSGGHVVQIQIKEDLNWPVTIPFGVIVSEVSLLSALSVLRITNDDGNATVSVTGPLPSQIGLLTGLTELQLTSNAALAGFTLPTELGALLNLTILLLENCGLVGRLPDMAKMTNMYLFSILNNGFTGIAK